VSLRITGCPKGYEQDNVTNYCIPCGPGTFNPYYGDATHPCLCADVGNEVPATEDPKDHEIPCPAGFNQSQQCQSSCAACPPGTSTGGQTGLTYCTHCTGQQYTSQPGTPACLDCNGIVSNDNTECTPCPSGENYNTFDGQCEKPLDLTLPLTFAGLALGCCLPCCGLCSRKKYRTKTIIAYKYVKSKMGFGGAAAAAAVGGVGAAAMMGSSGAVAPTEVRQSELLEFQRKQNQEMVALTTQMQALRTGKEEINEKRSLVNDIDDPLQRQRMEVELNRNEAMLAERERMLEEQLRLIQNRGRELDEEISQLVNESGKRNKKR